MVVSTTATLSLVAVFAYCQRRGQTRCTRIGQVLKGVGAQYLVGNGGSEGLGVRWCQEHFKIVGVFVFCRYVIKSGCKVYYRF